MVALHTVPTEAMPLDPSFRDGDLVLALPNDAVLDRAGADALVGFAAADPADAWFGDIIVGRQLRRRAAWSPTRILVDPLAAAPLATRVGWLRGHGLSAPGPELPFLLARHGADVAHITTPLTHHESSPTLETGPIHDHLAALNLPIRLTAAGELRPTDGFEPEVSIIVPTAGMALPDGTPAIRRLLERLGSLAERFEVVLVIGDEFEGDPTVLKELGHTVVRRPRGPFNFSTAVNLGVLGARHDVVLLLNDDTEPADDADADSPPTAFVDRMAMHLADPSVGAVGALLTYADGTVQHAGIVMDDARPLHPFVGWDPADTAVFGGTSSRDVIAVTGGCMMLRRADFLAVGGLSPAFPLSFNDVDLCVRLRRTGARVVLEPGARVVHHETLSRTPEIGAEEWDRWIHRWGEIVDPWYHPGYARPDDPHALSHNADHLPPPDGDPAAPHPVLRRPLLHSRVHRGRPVRVGG